MCGRYASFRDAEDLADEFAIEQIAQDARELPPSWNVAPTDPVRIVVERAERRAPSPPEGAGDRPIRAAGTPGGAGASRVGPCVRSLQVARWGLVPSWSKDTRGSARMINARAESLLDKRAFAAPLAARRCLVVADGYYEWRPPAPGMRAAKQPYYITGESTAAFAGLYEFWRDPERAADDPERWLVTTTIITTAAAPDLAPIHDRMPFALPPALWDDWLDPGIGARDAAALLKAPPVAMSVVAVSRAVGSVSNNSPDLIEPLANGLPATDAEA